MADPAVPPDARAGIARAYTLVEDIVYIALGALLSLVVVGLLVLTFIDFGRAALEWSLAANIVNILDRILLVLLIVELLYTVQVSFKAHTISAEPFLLIGLISAIRRVLVVTAELGELHKAGEDPTKFMPEIAALAGLILALA